MKTDKILSSDDTYICGEGTEWHYVDHDADWVWLECTTTDDQIQVSHCMLENDFDKEDKEYSLENN